ncbi:MAG: hypothetical protein GKR89_37820 [Candidatus Latescibacteria bacterium]|nr:hypothetical protein [Candidatus Latescibacterota bacterium]
MTQAPSTPFTAKAIGLGALLSLCIALGAPYANTVIRGSYMALDFSTPGAIFLFFLLTGLANGGLARLHSGLALGRGELLVVFIMMSAASTIPTMGLVEYLLPITTAVHYFATPENKWAALLHPYLPEWITPQDPTAIKYFYEGLPKHRSIPWTAWLVPLFWWGVFATALYLVMISAMVILRRQWVEHERLLYPLMQVPLEMISTEPHGRLSNLYRNPLMWVGFALPVLVSSLKGLHAYFAFLPSADLVTYIPILPDTAPMIFRLSFPMVGFTYLINLDIAFSLWFFKLLFTAAQSAMNTLGIASTEKLAYYAAESTPIIAHLGMGAMLTLVGFGLWTGRRHLKQVFAGALGLGPRADDSGEMLSYRTAVVLLAGGLLVMTAWLHLSGLPLWAAAALLILALLIFVGLTRMVVEGGLAEAVAPMTASSALVSAAGSSALGASGMVGIAFNFVWAADIRTFVMAAAAHSLKLGEHLGTRLRPLFWVILLAIGLSFAGSVIMLLYLSYTYGGINLNGWFFGAGATNPFTYAARLLQTSTGPHLGGWLLTGLGAAGMTALMWMRHHWVWWPLHYLGFPIGGVWIIKQVWFSIFLAWLIKLVVMQYGGPRLYKATRPFFLGLIIGQFVVAGVWLVIDYCTGMTDNTVFWI